MPDSAEGSAAVLPVEPCAQPVPTPPLQPPPQQPRTDDAADAADVAVVPPAATVVIEIAVPGRDCPIKLKVFRVCVPPLLLLLLLLSLCVSLFVVCVRWGTQTDTFSKCVACLSRITRNDEKTIELKWNGIVLKPTEVCSFPSRTQPTVLCVQLNHPPP